MRQQLSGSSSRNMLATAVNVFREDGALAFYRGVSPAVARGVLYGGLRIGLYKPLKDVITAEGDSSSLGIKIVAGMMSGAVAAAVCNPIDLVKTRMQAKGEVVARPFAVAAAVIKSDGIVGLWKGTTPSMVSHPSPDATPAIHPCIGPSHPPGLVPMH